MKHLLRLNLLIVLSSSFFFVSCDKIKDAVKVDVAMQTADVNFTIQPQAAGTQTLSEFVANLNIDSAIKANSSQFGINNIKSVKILSVKVNLLNGEGVNTFGALSDCKMEFSSSNKPAKVTLATLSNNPDAASSVLDLPVNSSLELKEYFSATSFNYTLSGTTRRATTQALNCKATIKFNVQVGL